MQIDRSLWVVAAVFVVAVALLFLIYFFGEPTPPALS
jgi:hypothetical protein